MVIRIGRQELEGCRQLHLAPITQHCDFLAAESIPNRAASFPLAA